MLGVPVSNVEGSLQSGGNPRPVITQPSGQAGGTATEARNAPASTSSSGAAPLQKQDTNVLGMACIALSQLLL